MQRTTVRLPDDLLEEARDLARRTSRTFTQLLEDAVRAQLKRTPTSTHLAARSEQAASPQHVHEQLRAQVADIQAFLRTIPDRDSRPSDEILGYDANGLPA